MDDVNLGGLKSIHVPKQAARRTERCDACYWSERVQGGGIECHGEPPTLNLLVEPAAVQPGQVLRPGQPQNQVLRPICMWPQVPPHGFCRHWELRAEEPIRPE